MNLTKEDTSIIWISVRQFLYFVLTYAFIACIYVITKHFKGATFHEHGAIENLQLSLLIISGIIFALHAYCHKEWGTLSLLLASCCCLAAFRELDKLFDQLRIAWAIGFVFPVAALAYAAMNFEKLFKMALKFIGQPSFFMMCCAVIIILPIAQFVGHRPLVVAILGNTRKVQIVKEFFEECCECIGYFLILLSTLEYIINTRHLNSKK